MRRCNEVLVRPGGAGTARYHRRPASADASHFPSERHPSRRSDRDQPHPPTTLPPLRTQVRDAVARAWRRAIAAGALPAVAATRAARRSRSSGRPTPEHGDFAANLAMKLARPYRRAPLDIADGARRRDRRRGRGGRRAASPIASAEVAPPGLPQPAPDRRRARGDDRARSSPTRPAGAGSPPVRPRPVNVEFVSANPTGPLTIGNARGAFVGDLLCRVLEAGGQRVTREYYFNDSGAPGRATSARRSLAVRRGEPSPRGRLPRRLRRGARARAVPDDVLAAADGRRRRRRRGVRRALGGGRGPRAGIEASLERLGVHFDVWTSEGSLHDEGWVERAIERLRGRRPRLRAGRRALVPLDRLRRRQGPGHHPLERPADLLRGRHRLRHREVQPRLRPPDLHLGRGPPRDGRPGPQRRRGDGLRPRTRSRCSSTRWVRFIRDGEEISMSKRAGEFITLDELLAEVGVDAARWFFASRAATTGIDFDIELAKKQSAENPVYYVQYAHARIASILRKAAEVGLAPAAGRRRAPRRRARGGPGAGVARFPEVVEDAAAAEETHGVTAYATELATAVPRVLPRRAGRRPGRAGALGRPAGARGRGRGSRSPTRSACWGSPRPNRCRRASQPAERRATPSAPAAVSAPRRRTR